MSNAVLRAIANPERDPALDIFLHWCDVHNVPALSATPATIAAFVMQAQTLGIEKLALIVSAISRAYLARGLADPTAGGAWLHAINKIANVAPPRSWLKDEWADVLWRCRYDVQTPDREARARS